MKHHRLALAALSVSLLALASCAGGPPPPAAEPDEAHDRIVRGLADGQPEAVWDALPDSYQRDLAGLVHEAGAAADREIWTRAFAVLQKLTRVLAEKKQFILQNQLVAMQLGSGPDVDRGWDALVDAFDTLARSELADPARVASLDVRGFLAGTGSRLMKRVLEAGEHAPRELLGGGVESLRATTAEIVSRQDDGALLRIETPGEEPREERWIRVEGKWVPAEWTEDWGTRLDEVRGGLRRMSTEMDEQDRQQALLRLTMVEGVLDRLLAAKTESEFNAALGTALAMVLGALG